MKDSTKRMILPLKSVVANSNNLAKIGRSKNISRTDSNPRRKPLRSLSVERDRKKIEKQQQPNSNDKSGISREELMESINLLAEHYDQLQCQKSLFTDRSLIRDRSTLIASKCVPKSKISLLIAAAKKE